MARILRPALCAIILVALGACSLFQETPQQRAQRLEPMLSAAGFNMLPADNDQKLSALQGLPPLKMRYYTKDGKLRYWFADPNFCHCVYTGDQTAYQRYENLKIQARLAEQAQMTAEENEEAAEEMVIPGPFLLW